LPTTSCLIRVLLGCHAVRTRPSQITTQLLQIILSLDQYIDFVAKVKKAVRKINVLMDFSIKKTSSF